MVDQRPQQLRAAVHRRHDLHVVRGEQPDQAVPEEGQVLAKDNSHGSSMVTWVGPPGGLVTATIPSKAAQPPLDALQPAAGARMGAAGAVVADDRDQPAVVVLELRPRPGSAPLCLTTLASASAMAK